MVGKIDIEITLKNNKLAKFDIGDTLTVTIDTDYVDDIEDVYCGIEDYIWETYGVSLHYGEDFDIDEDKQEIIDEIFN